MKYKFKKGTGSDYTLGKVAKKVSDFSGGKGLTDYYGGKGTKMGAVKSAALVGTTAATGVAGVGRAVVGRALAKTVAKQTAKRVANAGRGPLAKMVDRKFRRQDEEIFKHWRKK